MDNTHSSWLENNINSLVSSLGINSNISLQKSIDVQSHKNYEEYLNFFKSIFLFKDKFRRRRSLVFPLYQRSVTSSKIYIFVIFSTIFSFKV